jgi:hypothetical protein
MPVLRCEMMPRPAELVEASYECPEAPVVLSALVLLHRTSWVSSDCLNYLLSPSMVR